MEPTPISPNPAAEYRAAHRNRLMVLTTLKGVEPGQDEFCRIRSVESVEPGLWLTVDFLDGARRGLRPDRVRCVTAAEELLSRRPLAPLS